MTRYFDFLDRFAGVGDEKGPARWLDRTAFVFVTLMVLTAPHSIAASQTSWVLAAIATILRFALKPRRPFKFRPLDIAIWLFFAWSVVSSLFSYSQATSLDRLKGVLLFVAYFVVAANIRHRSAAIFLGFALFVSCMVNVFWTPIHRIVGRGVEIHGVDKAGPLAKAGLIEGDTILKVDSKRVTDPAQITDALRDRETVAIFTHRPDLYRSLDIHRSDLLPGTTVNEQLGMSSWGPSHYWRAMGFFNHWTTYSEALQLIMSLAFGLMAASFFKRKEASVPSSSDVEPGDHPNGLVRFITSLPFLIFCVGGMGLALLLTVTRASQLSVLISAMVIVVLTASRKFLIAAILVAIPVAAIGLFMLERTRQVGFVDAKDESTLYRQMMWRDGFRLLTDSPRNFIFGIGMDSVHDHWEEWKMFDNGWQPMGHFHSTPIQIVVERGVPALLLWFALLAIYARTLWRGIRSGGVADWRMLGIMLGCLGGAIGFVTSGFVHNNLGDGEVAMIFYIMMGIGIRNVELSRPEPRI